MTLSHLLKSTVPASASVLLPSNPVLLSLKSIGKYPLASQNINYSPKYTKYSEAPSQMMSLATFQADTWIKHAVLHISKHSNKGQFWQHTLMIRKITSETKQQQEHSKFKGFSIQPVKYQDGKRKGSLKVICQANGYMNLSTVHISPVGIKNIRHACEGVALKTVERILLQKLKAKETCFQRNPKESFF